MSYIRPINQETTLYYDNISGLAQFQYNNQNVGKNGGVILRLQTIPGEVYHLFSSCKLIMGDFVDLEIINRNPVIRLDRPQKWKIGNSEVKTQCFKALGNLTDLYLTTRRHKTINNGPYQFLMESLDIIPDSLSCQGYIEGTTGHTGVQGPQGPIGFQGPTGIGPIGNQGEIGDEGEQGLTGLMGQTGIGGGIGSIGGIGPVGMQSPLRGDKGTQGIPGVMGGIGPIGYQGPQGTQGTVGSIGPDSYRVSDNVLIDQVTLNWTRGGPIIAINTVTFQRTGGLINIRMSAFACVGSSGFETSCLNSISLPNDYRTLEFRNSFFPCIIEVDGVPKNVTIEIGPVIIIIYSDLDFGCDFTPGQVVFFPEQTFQYHRDDVEI